MMVCVAFTVIGRAGYERRVMIIIKEDADLESAVKDWLRKTQHHFDTLEAATEECLRIVTLSIIEFEEDVFLRYR